MSGAHTIRSSSFIGFDDVVRELGFEPDPILREFGIQPEALVDPNLRISTQAVCGAFARAAELSPHSDFAFRLARRRNISTWGLGGAVLQDLPTLGDMLRALRRVARLQNDSLWVELGAVDDTIELRLTFGVDLEPEASRIAMEVTTATCHRNFSALAGSAWQPSCVCFRNRRPSSTSAHEKFFGYDVLFEQGFNGFVLHREDLSKPILRTANPEAGSRLESMEALLRASPQPLSEQVVEVAVRLLPEGRCSREIMAAELGLTVRTMQRRLAEQGDKFPELVNRARDILIQSYVDGSERPFAEVADLLGFMSQAAFTHWHTARHGMSPTARRKAWQAQHRLRFRPAP